MTDDGPKSDLAAELRRTLTSLTEDALRTAMAKCVELGFDQNRGRIPFADTLNELTQARAVLDDALEQTKFDLLPIKLRGVLVGQAQTVERELLALVNGTDAVVNLASAVEELNASIWLFQLQNLSGKLLGLQSKMNQLKSQEASIREATEIANEFVTARDKADKVLEAVSKQALSIEEKLTSATNVVDQLQTTLRESGEAGQKVAAVATQVAQHETTVIQQLANAKQAAADTIAIAAKSTELRTEIEAHRESLRTLTTQAQDLISTTTQATTEKLASLTTKADDLTQKTEAATAALTEKVDRSITETITKATDQFTTLMTSSGDRLNSSMTEAEARLLKVETDGQARLTTALDAFAGTSEEAKQRFITTGNDALKAGDEERTRLIEHLNELEGRIKVAVEKATGYTLFHAFQRRQEDVAKAKDFWSRALAGCVVISLLASGYFIYRFNASPVVDAAFFLKLSISIPLIYAIAFCNLQYSHERKLEEEYAFKSSVSISLDPYKNLVDTLIDKNKPEELAKYSDFVIASINRIFTSPTEQIFKGSQSDSNQAEKIIKAMGDVIEPLFKGLRK